MVQQQVEHCPNMPRDSNMNFILDMTRTENKCQYPLATIYAREEELTEEELLRIAEEVLEDEGYGYIPVVIDSKVTEEAHCLAMYRHGYSPEPLMCDIVLSPELLSFDSETIKEILQHELRHHEDRLEAFEESYEESISLEEEYLNAS